MLDGAPEYQLFQVRDALRLRDGRIVVPNAGTNEVRFYGDDGSYLMSVGRQGGGPGEFESIALVRPFLGDSLLTYDVRQSRVTIWDSQEAAEQYESSGQYLACLTKLKHTFSRLYQWKMALERDKDLQVKTSDDVSLSHYTVVAGKCFE